MKECCEMHGGETWVAKCGQFGRFLYAIPMGVFGVFHFLHADQMVGYLAGWPMAKGLIYISGAGLILAAIAIIIDKHAKLASLLLALMLALFILFLHLPGVMAGGASSQMAMMSLLKDAALMGGALVIAANSCGMCCMNGKKGG